MKISKFFYVLLCIFAFRVQAAELNIRTDKTAMTEGDSLFLTIEYKGDSNETPGLDALAKDFQIVSNSTSRQVNIINGVMNQVKKWTIELKPLRTGKITIPPLKLGDLTSNYATVDVKEVTNVAFVPDSKENSNSPYFQIEQTLDTDSLYVQQQAIILVTIYDSIGLQDGSINISEESKKDWSVIPIFNKPVIRQEVINGRQMNVINFAFAAFAQRSGNLTTPQVLFEGFYVKNSDFEIPHFEDDLNMFGINFHNVFGQKVPVRMKTKAENIFVRPIPAEASGKPWFPLKDLTLEASWQNKTPFKVGEAANRQIKLTATGMQANMLPPFKFADADGLKQYPEKPETSETIVKGQVVTTATINNVYIPTKSGKLTIPSFELYWFNVETNRLEKAVIPAETIDVLPGNDVFETSKPQPLPSAIEADNEDIKEKIADTEKLLKKKEEISKTLYDKVLDNIYVLGAAIGVILLFFALRPRKGKENTSSQAVIRAIKQHDYKSAKALLLNWGREKFGDDNIKNLNMIADYARDDDFRTQLNALNKFLYSDSEDVFESAKFIEIFKRVDKIKVNVRKNKEVLPNLYD